MTPSEEKQLRDACAAATPAPWPMPHRRGEANAVRVLHGTDDVGDDDGTRFAAGPEHAGPKYAETDAETAAMDAAEEAALADAVFISMARSAVHALLAERDALMERVREAERRAEEAEAQAAAARAALVAEDAWELAEGEAEQREDQVEVRRAMRAREAHQTLRAAALAPDAGRALLGRLRAAEAERDALRAEIAEMRDRASIAEWREASAKANADQAVEWLDACNAGLVRLRGLLEGVQRESDALRARRAQKCSACLGFGERRPTVASPIVFPPGTKCEACGGAGAVIVDGPTT